MTGSDVLSVRHGDVAAKVIDGEAILINLTTGLYYSMGKVGGRIWALIEQGCSKDGIAAAIASEYSVSGETAAADLADLVADLLAEQLVESKPSNGSAHETAEPDAAPNGGDYSKPELKKFSDMAEIFAMDPPLPGLAERKNG
jgi:hypothetical protein